MYAICNLQPLRFPASKVIRNSSTMSLSFGYRSESDPVMESTTSNLPIIANTVVDPAAICKN